MMKTNSISTSDENHNNPQTEEFINEQSEVKSARDLTKEDALALVVPLSIAESFPTHLQRINNHADFYYGIAPLMAGETGKVYIVEDSLINLFGINQLKVDIVLEAPGMLPVNLILDKPEFYKIVDYKTANIFIRNTQPSYPLETDDSLVDILEGEQDDTNL